MDVIYCDIWFTTSNKTKKDKQNEIEDSKPENFWRFFFSFWLRHIFQYFIRMSFQFPVRFRILLIVLNKIKVNWEPFLVNIDQGEIKTCLIMRLLMVSLDHFSFTTYPQHNEDETNRNYNFPKKIKQ